MITPIFQVLPRELVDYLHTIVCDNTLVDAITTKPVRRRRKISELSWKRARVPGQHDPHALSRRCAGAGSVGGGDNTVKPRFDMASKRFTMSWVRKLDGGRSVTADIDPDNSLSLSFEGDNDDDWKASVSAPWGDFKDADVSFGRKFNF